MALKTNFTDDILAESMNGKRQYNVTENSNGTKSLEDVTDYQSVGSTLSAKDMNETNAAVNQAYDDMGDEFNKDTKYLAGSVKIHNNKLWKFKVDHDPGEFDESQVEKTTLLGEIGELTEKLQNISFGFSTNSIIKTISSRTETYTAVQDCWCVGRIKGSSGNPCGIKLDDVLLFNLDIIVYAPIVFPVKKGQTVSITGAGTICSFDFFS